MKKIILLLIITGSFVFVSAQTISPQTLPAAGNFSSNGGVSLSSTIGQTFNATLSGGTYYITQGFQQPNIVVIAPSITNTVVSSYSFCQGSSLSVNYTATGTFNPGNIFTAQLSDALGDFTSPVAIGNLVSITAGTINATIPVNTPLGAGYRIRVVSDDPVVIGTDNGADLTINPNANAGTISGPSQACEHVTSVNFTSNGDPGGLWNSSNPSVATININSGLLIPVGPGNTVLTYTINSGCNSPVSTSYNFQVNPSASITSQPVSTSVCEGGSATFSVGVTPATNVFSYQWRIGTTPLTDGGNVSGSNTATLTINPATSADAANNYNVQIGALCLISGNQISNNVALNILPDANAGKITVTSPLCAGQSLLFTSDGDAGGFWSSSDNSIATVDPVTGEVTALDAGVVDIIYTINSGCNSPVIATFVLVVDREAIFTSCPGNDVTQNTDPGECTAEVNYIVAANGFPAPVITYSFSGATSGSGAGTGSGSIFNIGTTTVTIIATNNCGSTSCQFDVVVSDNEPPLLTCPTPDPFYNVDPGSCSALLNFNINPSDNCGLASLSGNNMLLNHSADEPLVNGNIPHWQEIIGSSWTQRNADPLPHTGSSYFFPGAVSVGELRQDIDISGDATLIDNGNKFYYFNGYVRSWPQSPNDQSNILIKYHDATNSVLQTIHLGPYNQTSVWLQVDSLMLAPADARTVSITLRSVRFAGSNNDGYYDELYFGNPTSSYYSVNGTLINLPYVFPVGTTTVDVNVTDINNNTSTCSFDVNVIDNIAPVFDPTPPNAVYNCITDVPAPGLLGWSDNCDGSGTVVAVDVSDGMTCPEIITRTWTYADISGNISSVSQTITVQDNIAPVISGVGPNSTAQCATTPTFSNPVVADNCDPNPTLVWTDDTTPGVCVNNYSVTRTWTAIDACGNASTASQTFVFNDDTAPVISGMGATQANCGEDPVFNPVTVTDNCDPNPTVVFTDATTGGDCSTGYSVTRTWTATDDCGNSVSTAYTVLVHDDQPPVITGPIAPAPVTCDQQPVWPTPTVTDNCDPNPTLVFTDAITPGNCPASYTWTRTWTATDACGNTISLAYVLIAEDNTAPVISGMGATQANCGEDPVFNPVTVTDNCDPNPTVVFTDATTGGDCSTGYSVTRTWTATDDCGNSVSTAYTVLVHDDQPPVITGPIAPAPVTCDQQPVWSTPTVTDDCDPNPTLVFTDAITPGNCPASYTWTRTWTATDACGNTISLAYVLNAEDDTAPVIAGVGADATIECPALPVFSAPTVTDDCDANATLFFTDAITPGICPQEYIVTRTWTATDACGNSSIASQTITVEDNTAPVIQCTADLSFCDGDPVILIPPVANDACGNVTITNDAPANFGPGVHTVTWSATDACGQSSTCTQNVTIHYLNALVNVEDVLCYGDNTGSITLSSFTIPATDPADILYSIDGGLTTQSSNVFGSLVAGNYLITVINTNANCTTTVNATINEPAAPLTVATSSTNTCPGGSTGTVSATPSGGTSGYVIEWFDVLNTKVNNENAVGAGTYTVIVTDANGCTATGTVTVNEYNAPVVSLGNDKVVFYGALGFNGCHTLTTAATGNGPFIYSWSATDPNPAIGTNTGGALSVCVTLDVIYTYTVIVTDANGCTASASVNVIYTNIDCSSQLNAGKVTMCLVPPGNPSNCKTVCLGVTAAQNLLNNGSYLGPCLPNCAIPQARAVTSVPFTNYDVELNVYPNPTSGNVHIEYRSETDNAEWIVITDLQGRTIKTLDIKGAFEFHGSIDISHFDNGIYFINITGNNSVIKTSKVVKAE